MPETNPPSSHADRDLLTVEEAAHRIHCSRSKTYELIAAGAIQTVKIDSLRRVPRDAIDDFIKRLQTNPPPTPESRDVTSREESTTAAPR